MADSQVWNTLGYIEKCLVAAKASMNASALGSEGDSVKLMNCGIDTMRISTLGEYLAARKRAENPVNGKGWDKSLEDDDKLARCFVVPVTLPNGQEIEVIVNKDGQDMACMYKDEAGNEKEFQLTPRMKKEIETMTPDNLKEVLGEEVYQKEFMPENLDEFAEKVSDDELVPKNKKHAAKIAGITVQELEEKEQEKEEAMNELPAEARDSVARICSEHGLDIASLKEVMEVPPQTISDNLEGTGIKENNGKVTCLRFKDGEKLQGRVVMVQGDYAVDNRMYDDYMNDYMNEHKGEKVVKTTEDEHDKLTYTDLDGNTTTCEITREPRDLNCSDKEALIEEMSKLDCAANQILTSEMPIEDKTQEMIKINGKRKDLFKEYGIEVPIVENEIEADIEISEEIYEEVTGEQEMAELEQGDDEPEAFEVPGKRTH